MTRTPEQVSRDIRARLNQTDPSLSAEVGTPERKIIDAVSEVIAGSYIDSQLVASGWDLDTKVGIELDQLTGLFGFGRHEGKRAKGRIRVTLRTPAASEVVVPVGTVVFLPATDVNPQVDYTTQTVGVIPPGQTATEVDIECTAVGSIGNTTINTVIGSQGFTATGSVTNHVPITGGLDAEDDDGLRERFRNTFLRNLAGTRDFYAALCLQSADVSKVKIVGPVEKYREQVQIQNMGNVTSGNNGAKFTWPRNTFLIKDQGLPTEEYMLEGVDFLFDVNVNPPVLKPLSAAVNNQVLDLEYEYTPRDSRNEPVSGLTNKVDIFINGSRAVDVEELRQYTPVLLNSTAGSNLNASLFELPDRKAPASGGSVLPLSYQPVAVPPTSITVGSTVRTLGKDYHLVRRRDGHWGSVREFSGLYSPTALFPTGTNIRLTYSHNQLPGMLGTVIDANRQITSDPLVREVRRRYFRINLVIAYQNYTGTVDVDRLIRARLAAWMETLGYGDWIQGSDIEALVHGIGGVDAVRLATSADGVAAGIVETNAENVMVALHTSNVKLSDTELGYLADVTITRRSQNNFGG